MNKKVNPIAKAIFESNDVENGYTKLTELSNEYPEYKAPLKSWFDIWNELSSFFEYAQEVRKIMYKPNTIVSLKRLYYYPQQTINY